MSDATRILSAIQQGDAKAADELFPLIYDELRKLAAHRLSREGPNQTLQPTALVHEAWLRLVGSQNPQFAGCGHFFAAAAEAMRRILIDRARQKRSLKRGVGLERVNLDEAVFAVQTDDETLLLVNDALEKLTRQDPDSAQLIKLRFFGGMTNEEAALALGISVRTAKRYWTFARAWLFQEISAQNGAGH